MSRFVYEIPDEIDAPEADYLYVRPSNIEQGGQGLFTAIGIEKNEVIALYHGNSLSPKEAAHKAELGQDRYFIHMPDGSILDSQDKACFAKYANDACGISESTYHNNSIITLNSRDAVCLVALRNIIPGEEIFCGYGKKYWKNQAKKLPQ